MFDYDLEALAFINKQQEEPEHFSLGYFSVQSGSSIMATASVKPICGGGESRSRHRQRPGRCGLSGDQSHHRLPDRAGEVPVDRQGHGRDALGQVDIVVSYSGRRFHGVGLATDIVESSAKAMVHVLNNIWRSQQVEKKKQRLQKANIKIIRKRCEHDEDLSHCRLARRRHRPGSNGSGAQSIGRGTSTL